MERKKLVIIDSNSVIHRAFHALPPLTDSKGEPTNAVYGFLLVFLKITKEIGPDFIVATFDYPAPTFRHEQYKEYKGKRPPVPKELYQQIPKVKEILKAFNVPIFEKKGFEADDLISTIVKKVSQGKSYQKPENYILTGDLDSLQLVDEQTKVYTLGRGVKETIIYDAKRIKERFDLGPRQMIDFKSLAGDTSDNIPGAAGIGQKTAIELLKKYNNLENLYKKLEQNQMDDISPRIKDILLKNKERVFLSQMLAKTKNDVSIDFVLEKCKFGNFNEKEVEEILKKFEFYSLIEKVLKLKGDRDNGTKQQKTLW